MDIGANDPIVRNNTYLFYKNGSRGICIEPNPNIYTKLKKIRPHDICLNIGIGDKSIDNVPYYMLTSGALNTFSKEEAENHTAKENYGKQKIESIINLPLKNINSIIDEYLSNSVDILSIDTEGFDLKIISSLNFKKCRPKVICVETARYEGNKIEKTINLIEFLKEKNYLVFGDTFINSIFVDRSLKLNLG
ncbi:MAG: FkbM family methyltransferase [Patescibacteria group bacterium]